MTVNKLLLEGGGKHLPSESNRVLVAGFDAFDKLKANPSQTIVETLGAAIKLPGRTEQVLLDTVVLPTCCSEAWSTLQQSLDANKNEYSSIILTGVAALRKKISLERFALNIRDYRIKDNSGHQHLDELIEDGAPNALRTGLSVARMEKSLIQNGVLCEVSNHAGTFVCNEVYYKCLRYQEKLKSPAQVLFVHLPLPNIYFREFMALRPRPKGVPPKATGIDLMRIAVMQIVEQSLV